VIPTLVQAFPDWVYVIKGDGPLRESVRETIRAIGLEQKVFLMTEELAPTELPALYRSFDVFTLPTRLEGFGMVFAEAMAMGLPVVAPRIAPVTEIVSSDTGILVEPDNSEALRDALSGLMADGKLRAELAQKAHERALEKWCGKKAAHKVIAEYQRLLAKKQVKP
jgi:glycosyltransferase involved in cell wall biosynthesis